MTVLATIATDASEIDLGEVLLGYDTQIELTQFVPIDGSLTPYFWAENHDLETFEEAVRDDSRVASLTNIDGAAGRRLYHIEWAVEMDSFLAALHEHDLFVERATGTDSMWTWKLRAASREPLAAFHTACREEGHSIEIQRVTPVNDDPTGAAYGLSQKQRDAVLTALDQGYFEIPRDRSLAELATELDISRTAYTRRLQRGLQTLLTNTIEVEAETDAD